MSVLKQIIRIMDPSIRRRNSSDALPKNSNSVNLKGAVNLQQTLSSDIKAGAVDNLIDSILKEMDSLKPSSTGRKTAFEQKLAAVFSAESGGVSGSIVHSKSMQTTLKQRLIQLVSVVENSPSMNQKEVELVRHLMNNLMETSSNSNVDFKIYLKNMYEFLTVIRSLATVGSPDFLRAAKSVLDDIFRLLVSYKVDGIGRENAVFSYSEKLNELSRLREPIFEPSYLRLISGNAGMPKTADKSFIEQLLKIADFGNRRGMELPTVEKIASLLKKGTTRPMTKSELQTVANLLGVEREAKLAKFISQNSTSIGLKYPVIRKFLFNQISSQLTQLSSGKLSPALYRKIDSGMNLFRNLFRPEIALPGDSKIISNYNIIQRLFYSRLAQGLSSHGIDPTAHSIIGSQVLLENNREVSKNSLNSLFNSSSAIINNIKIRTDLKPYLNASLLLKRLELPQTFLNAQYISDVLKVHSQLSGAFDRLESPQHPITSSSPSGLGRLSELSASLTAFIDGKSGNYKDLIEFSLAMGVKIPHKLVRLGIRSSNSPKSLLRESNAEFKNSFQRIKAGSITTAAIKNIIELNKISDYLTMNIHKTPSTELGGSEEIITKLGITKNKLDAKIGMRMIMMDMEISSGAIKKVSKFLLETLSIKESKISVPDINRALRMVKSDLPLNQKVWNEFRTFDILSPENERLISNYLNLLNTSAAVNKSDDGLKQLLELLLSISSGVGKKDSLKSVKSLLGRMDKIPNSLQITRTADKLNNYLGNSLKSELMTLEEKLMVTQSANQKDQIKSLLNSMTTLLDGIHILQANNSRQSNEFFFVFPFPFSPADGQAFFHYFKDQSSEGEDQMNIRLTLSPEPIGTIEVSIVKTAKQIDVTFSLERQEFKKLFLENIAEFGERLKSIGNSLTNVHCVKLIKKAAEELSLPGLYA
ncbi:MAG: flagellar hook-length control protein FliK [Candidatus Marinimicrobia bacterium]|nr:flagellar hook-length control protein FliK [Candidatus Neomarinimicrobiota bacterium]